MIQYLVTSRTGTLLKQCVAENVFDFGIIMNGRKWEETRSVLRGYWFALASDLAGAAANIPECVDEAS